MKKRITGLFIIFIAAILGISFYLLDLEKNSKKISILYTTDVHTRIDNEEGNGITYGNVVALRNELEKQGETVFLVDCGDNIQGSAYGGFDEGESVKNIMELAKYDASAVGNHEFDYGLFRGLQVMENSKYPYVACNFTSLVSDELMLPPYEIVERNGIKVGFIGITTPETVTKTTPAYFQDEEGNVVYGFGASEDGEEFYAIVQHAIDEIRDEVDYVVVMGHLGNEFYSEPYRSSDVIKNTSGIDLFLDGHSHMMVEKKVINDKAGKSVVLSQAGSYLGCVGVATIDRYSVKTKLFSDYSESDSTIDEAVANVKAKVDKVMGQKIAVLDNPLFINDENDNSIRLIRSQETNVADFVTDSYYWYFDKIINAPCDIAIANGGGLRADIEAGEFSRFVAKSIQPFGNMICMVEVSGQDVLNMLEWGSRYVGEGESGGLLHTAGLTYKIDSAMKSTVQEKDGVFAGEPTGQYKVSDVKVYNRETCEYEPLDLNKMYKVAGINYILRNVGDGYTMLKDSDPLIDYVNEDYEINAEFARNFEGGNDGFPHINNANSPMKMYTNYMYDYENPLGGGRMIVE